MTLDRNDFLDRTGRASWSNPRRGWGRRRVLGIAGVVGALLLVSACSSGGSGKPASGASTTPKASGPIVLGFPISTSGFVSFYDQPFLDGAKQAVADTNAKGGVLGRQLQIVSGNAKSDIAQEATVAQNVISQGAQFILPTVDYNFGGPAARVAQGKGLVGISGAGDPRYGRSGIGNLFFNVNDGAFANSAAGAVFGYTNQGWRRAYLLVDSTTGYTTSFCQGFQYAWKKLGGTIVGSSNFQNGDASIASQISQIQSASPAPDVVVLCSYPPGGATADRQIRAAGIKIPVLGTDSFDGTYWISSVPTESNFYFVTFGALGGDDPDAARNALLQSYVASHQSAKATLTANEFLTGYSSVQALVVAIGKAGTTDAQAVATAMEGFNAQPLAIGPTTWTSTCHVAAPRPILVLKVAAGHSKYVASVTPTQDVVKPAVC